MKSTSHQQAGLRLGMVPSTACAIGTGTASKIVITASGFSSEEREVIKSWVQQLGILYSGDLVCRTSTHLVAKDLLASFTTAKYYKALEWGMAIVSYRWVYDSLQAGKLLPLADYKKDSRGSADAALQQEVQRRRKVAGAQHKRIPLQALCVNQTDRSACAGASHQPVPIGCDPENAGAHGALKRKKDSDGRSSPTAPALLREQQLQPTEPTERGFTFDVPINAGTGQTRSPRIDAWGCRRTSQVPEDSRVAQSANHRGQLCAVELHAQQPPQLQDQQHQLLEPEQQSESSQDIGISQLCGPSVISVTVREAEEALTQMEGNAVDDQTPVSGVSFDEPYITRRSATVRPMRLNLDADADATGRPTGDAGSGYDSAAGCEDAEPAAEGVDRRTADATGAERVESPTPGSPKNVATGNLSVDADPARPASPPQQVATSILYSGFDPPLAAVATATKARRLVRNDRLRQESFSGGSVPTGPASRSAAPCDAQEGAHVEDLEDELEDDLEDEEEDTFPISSSIKPSAAGSKHADAAKAASARQHETRASGNARPPLVPMNAQPARPSLATSAVSVESLRSVWQQRQQQESTSTAPRRPAPGGSMGAIRAANKQQPPMQPPQQQAGFHAGAVRIKAEPGNEDAQGLLSSTSDRLHPETLAVKPEPGLERHDSIAAESSSDHAGPGGAIKPSARRRAAAIATASLISEPEPISTRHSSASAAPAVGTKAAGRRGRPAAAAASALEAVHELPHNGDVDVYSPRGGYETASSGGVTPSDVDALGDEHGGYPTDSLGSVGRGLSEELGDCVTPVPAARPEHAANGDQRAGRAAGLPLGPMAGPGTIQRILSMRTAGLTPLPASLRMSIAPGMQEETSESEATEGTRASSAALRHGGASKSRGPAGRPLAPAANDATGTDEDALTDSGADGDEDFRPKRGASMTGASSKRKPGARAAPAASVSATSASESSQLGVSSSQLPDDVSISRYLRGAVRMAESGVLAAKGGKLSESDMRTVKGLMRPPRSHTVKERHPDVSFKMVEFAEQVTVEPLRLLLNTRDRSRRARCPIIALPQPEAEGGEETVDVFLAEPVVLYKMPTGEWWLEYYRYYSASDVRALATVSGRTLHLPVDFSMRRELLRDTDRSHCRLTYVRGDLGVMRSKKLPPVTTRTREKPAFCRFIFDKHTGEVLTDQPTSDFVVGG